MPAHKKEKQRNGPGNAEGQKKLRQTTLLGSAAHSSPTQARKPYDTTPPNKSITSSGTKRRRVSESDDSSDLGAIKLEPVTPVKKSEDESDCSQLLIRSRAKKRRNLVVASGSDEDESNSSGSGAVMPRRRRPRRQARVGPVSPEEKSSSPPPRRFVSKGKAKQLDSDDDLSEGIDTHRIVESRLRVRGKKTAFQKNLERLKRKKMGKPMSSSDQSEELEESDQVHSSPFKGSRPASSGAGSLFSEDEDDSDGSTGFIVEDDSQAVTAQLPSEFSMRSHDDLSHQFKIIFQFFVHIAVRQGVDRHAFMEDQMKTQEYFAFPLSITRRKLSGLRDSLVASSAWRPKFKKALEDFPTFECVPLDFAVPSCDACHLGGRLSTVLGRLGGIPYDKLGFIDQIARDSEEDSGHDSDTSITRLKNSKFGFLEFHLGRFCARRVRVFHMFSHWEYHLFNTIYSELLAAKESKHGFVRVAFARGKQPPSDLSDADGLCEWLDERGIVDQEWQKMKSMMESAHKLELSAKKGEEDS